MGAGSVGGSGFNTPYINQDKVKKTSFAALIARVKEGYDNPSPPVKVKKPDPPIFNEEAYALDEEA